LSDLKFVAEIPRSSEETIRVFSGKYWNISVVDIRWYKGERPTRKGIRLNMEEARSLLHVLENIVGEENENI
tara:strand:- start:76 stop:291 length:216 start_codon:yes stop_codon:yes gene_type:complete